MRLPPVLPLAVASIVAIVTYHAIYAQFFPIQLGDLGHDFSLNMPKLLAGYYWYVENGLLEVPWFTPAFCGGLPMTADPNSLFYSVMQLLTLVVDPLMSIYLTYVIFSILGFAGFYFLLAGAFGASPSAAFLGASLFLFNGFYTYRMAIGHLTFHSYMLIPFIAYFCLRPCSGSGRDRVLPAVTDAAAGGFLFAYMFLAGGVHIVPIAGAATVALGLVHGAIRGREVWFWGRLALAGLMGALMTSFKSVGAFAYLGFFPRDHYKLPGAEGPVESFTAAFRALFFSPSTSQRLPEFTNEHAWATVGPLAFEHGVTFVPILVVSAAAAMWIFRRPRPWRMKIGVRWRSLLQWTALGLVLCVPIAVNTYEPRWNALLKSIPVLRNNFTLTHWYSILIPPVVLIAGLAFDQLRLARAAPLTAASLATLAIAIKALAPHTLYFDLYGYDPQRITASYDTVRSSGVVPEVHQISSLVKEKQLSMASWGNDDLVLGWSQLLCKESMFGYYLESFPRQPLSPGPVDRVRDGVFNLKNPSCYVFPKENTCRPGDHFRSDQADQVEQFRRYRPFEFAVPRRQRVANAASLLTTLAVGGLLLVRPGRGRRDP